MKGFGTKLRLSLLSLVVLSLVLGVLACGPAATPPGATPSPSPAKVAQWNFQRGFGGGTTGPWAESQLALAKLLENASDGKVKVTTQVDVFKDAEILDAVRDRRLDVGLEGMHYRPELAIFNFPSVPVVPRDKMPEVLNKLRPIFQDIADKQFGVKLIGFSHYPTQLVFSKKALNTVNDLKGYKIRVTGYELIQLLKEAGGAPMSVDYGEVYLSLQKGMIDGATSSLASLISMSWFDSTKYANWWPIGSTYLGILMNKDAWNELGPTGQQKLTDAILAWEKTHWTAVGQDDNERMAVAQQKGVTFITPSQAEKDKLASYASVVIADWKKRSGPRAEEVLSVINSVLGTKY